MIMYYVHNKKISNIAYLKNSEDFQFSGFQAILTSSPSNKYGLHYDYSRLSNATPSKDVYTLISRSCECHCWQKKKVHSTLSRFFWLVRIKLT